MFNSNINYSNYWFFKCPFALHSLVVQHSWYWNSPVECTDVLQSDLYERSVLRQTTCLLLLMKGEVKKHVYKDLRNKTQHLCAFFPSCNSSYINFVANLLFRRKLEAVVWEGHQWWLWPFVLVFALSALFRYYMYLSGALNIDWCSVCS